MRKVAIARGHLAAAHLYADGANHAQRLLDGMPIHEDEPIYWDMLGPAMQRVLLAHGGTRESNLDARPSEWKENGPGVDLWVYRSDGATIATYVFTDGKLTDTLKP